MRPTGSKFAAAASDSAIRTYEQIAAEVLAEAAAIDQAEDERYGEARGDELPEHVASREGRRAWLKEAKRRLDAERAQEPVPKAREERLEICHRRLVEDWRAECHANRAYEASYDRGVRERGKQAMGPGRADTSRPQSPRARSTRPTPTHGG